MKCKLQIINYDDDAFEIDFGRHIYVDIYADVEYITWNYRNFSKDAEANYKYVRILSKMQIEHEKYTKIANTLSEKIK